MVTAAQTATAEPVVVDVPAYRDAPRLLSPGAPRSGIPATARRPAVGGPTQPIGGKPAVASVVTLPAPPRLLMPSGRPSCNCPEWHALRVFGHGRGRHRVSFEAGDDGLVSPEVDSVCAVCGYGLRTTATAEPNPAVADRA